MSDRKVVCVCCKKQMDNYALTGFQPVGGLAFITRGHYGSAYFDPMSAECLEICVCDDCVKTAEEVGIVYRGV